MSPTDWGRLPGAPCETQGQSEKVPFFHVRDSEARRHSLKQKRSSRYTSCKLSNPANSLSKYFLLRSQLTFQCAPSFSVYHLLRCDLLAPQLSEALAPQEIDVGELSGRRHKTQDSGSSRRALWA